MQRLIGLAGIGLFAVIAAEIAVFVVVAHGLGVGLALILLAATSLIGGTLLRREGSRAWRRLRESALSGRRFVGTDISQGLPGLLSGLLLAVPGFVTDVVGLALLVPAVRRLAGIGVQRLAERQLSSAVAADLFGPRRVRVRRGRPYRASPRPGGSTIEGEIIDH